MHVLRIIGKIGRAAVIGAALLFFLQLFFAFFGIPRWLVAPVSNRGGPPPKDIRHIVVLGGGGIPSESGLLRTYCAAAVGTNYPTARFIVSLPSEQDCETSSVGRMRDELVLRGIPAGRIRLESQALSTHEQAANIGAMLGPDQLGEPVLLVTSGLHTKRAVLSFRRAGFTRVYGLTSWEVGAEADAGPNLLVRYAVWANLEAEVQIAREACALLYYKLRGWI